MKDYVVLDVETPNFKQNSISAIGLLLVRDNKIINSKYTLINPEDTFDSFNINLTKITPEMVSDKPTFKEYWPEIEDWLINNIVVGHNVTFDLGVVSRSLQKYNLQIPDFDYCCTLHLSRKTLNLNSYKLTNIAKSLNIVYDAHNAIEDARATYEVLEYINRRNRVSYNSFKHYHYSNNGNGTYPRKLSKNINNLYGITRVIIFNQNITDNQLALLNEWLIKNEQYKEYPIFKNIIIKLRAIVNKDAFLSDIKDLVKPIQKSSLYNKETLKIQVLQGIISAIVADNQVTFEELLYLDSWLKRNKSLKGYVLYDNVVKHVTQALKKGTLTIEEEEKLSDLFEEWIYK